MAYIPFNVILGVNQELDLYEEVVFLFDILLNLWFRGRFCYIKSSNGLSIYLRSWFWIDLITVFPFWLLSDMVIFELPILLKFIKVSYFLNLFNRSLIGRWRDAFTFFSLLILTILVAHLIACMWMLLGRVEPSKTEMENYLLAMYWAMTTITTIGYGDITPQTNAQIIFTMVVQITGVTIFGFLIGKIAGVFSKKDPAEIEYYSQIEKLDALHRRKAFPDALYNQIKDYFGYRLENRLGSDETEFLSSLPDSLRQEVSMHLKSDLIEKIPLFLRLGKDFVEKISQVLTLRVAIPNEYLFRAGDTGEDMYFIAKGEVEVVSASGEYITTLLEGNFFGEIALIKNQPRNASVLAKTFCNLYRLSKRDFEDIMSLYPEVAEEIRKKASLRS